MTTSTTLEPRIGARVLLLDPDDRVLLIHARDPDDPNHHWWELPGGGLDDGETPTDAARREVAEETGLTVPTIGRKLWTRESHFTYRNRQHHRFDHVYLARVDDTSPTVRLKPTANERAGLIERRWWTAADLRGNNDKMLPSNLPGLLDDVLTGRFPDAPLQLSD